MYEKCISCERLGKDCFPNLCVMEMEDIRTWAKLRLKYKGWTYADLSEASGVPKGTIAYSFSQKGVDVNYSTFAPVLCALIDCPPGEYPCPEPSVDVSLLQEKYSQLEQENGELKLRANEAEGTHREDIRTTKAEKQKTIGALKQDLKFCQEQILHKDRVIKQCKTRRSDLLRRTCRHLYRQRTDRSCLHAGNRHQVWLRGVPLHSDNPENHQLGNEVGRMTESQAGF